MLAPDASREVQTKFVVMLNAPLALVDVDNVMALLRKPVAHDLVRGPTISLHPARRRPALLQQRLFEIVSTLVVCQRSGLEGVEAGPAAAWLQRRRPGLAQGCNYHWLCHRGNASAQEVTVQGAGTCWKSRRRGLKPGGVEPRRHSLRSGAICPAPTCWRLPIAARQN